MWIMAEQEFMLEKSFVYQKMTIEMKAKQ